MTRHTGAMRLLAALALDTCDALDVDPLSVEVDRHGGRLMLTLGDYSTTVAQRVAEALGVVELHTHSQESTTGRRLIYTVGSKAPRESWHKPDHPVYFGASVPFDGALVEMTVTVYVDHVDEVPA